MEAKVKMLLDSENSDSFILGVNLAKSVLGWTDFDILNYSIKELSKQLEKES